MTVKLTSKIKFTGFIKFSGEAPPPEPLTVEWITPPGEVFEGYQDDEVNFMFEAETVEA